jgi:hypothetical protein
MFHEAKRGRKKGEERRRERTVFSLPPRNKALVAHGGAEGCVVVRAPVYAVSAVHPFSGVAGGDEEGEREEEEDAGEAGVHFCGWWEGREMKT